MSEFRGFVNGVCNEEDVSVGNMVSVPEAPKNKIFDFKDPMEVIDTDKGMCWPLAKLLLRDTIIDDPGARPHPALTFLGQVLMGIASGCFEVPTVISNKKWPMFHLMANSQDSNRMILMLSEPLLRPFGMLTKACENKAVACLGMQTLDRVTDYEDIS
jgi:hypothetical protein